ncbi:MAG: ribbon-helix-helix domain-containing protein [Nitrososphaerota archaeon]|nr:ribbon-helix-helix domain-containing protein [Nitrososphaerota archaeon]
MKSNKNKEKEMMRGNMKLVTVLLPEAHLEGLEELVRAKMYQNRSAAIRNAVRDLLRNELYEAKKSRR